MKNNGEKVLYIVVGILIIVAILIIAFPEKNTKVNTLVSSVSLSDNELSLVVKDKYHLEYKIYPTNATSNVTYSSSDTSIVSVDNDGNIEALKKGNAFITIATDNGKKAVCAITVSDNKVAVTKITLDKDEVEIEVGKSYQLKATISPSNATSKVVSWSVDDQSIATVSGGKVTGKKEGITTVTAKTGNGKVAISNITVIASKTPVTPVTPTNPTNPTNPVTPTNPTTPTNSTKPITADSICESVKNNATIDYKSFAILQKDKDDYYVIKAAHDCANKYNKPVSVTKGEYNIYKKNNVTISVQTNTNLNNSTIYIHDEYSGISNYSFGDGSSIFTIELNAKNKCISGTKTGFSNAFASLAPITGNYFVSMTEQNGVMVYNRNKGSGETSQAHKKSESYRVYNGKVQDPMFWDYNNSKVKYTVCPIPSDTLVFQNATVKTITKKACDSKCTEFASRGIMVTRSNTKIYNIKHSYVDKNDKPIHVVNHKYEGMFRVLDAANVTFKDCVVYSLTYMLSNNKADSTYDIGAKDSVNITIDGVKMSKVDKNYNQLQKSSDWGVMGTSKVKGLKVLNSELNRVDAHRNIYNLTIKDTVIGIKGITVAGTGDRKDNKMVIENVTLKYASSLVRLRHDYGDTWNGTISIKNCKVENATSNTLVLVNILNFTTNANKKLVFNQPIYNPTKITVDGLKVSSSNVTKIEVINGSKKDFENYYLSYFQRKTNKNEATKISKNNITGHGSGNVVNYAG